MYKQQQKIKMPTHSIIKYQPTTTSRKTINPHVTNPKQADDQDQDQGRASCLAPKHDHIHPIIIRNNSSAWIKSGRRTHNTATILLHELFDCRTDVAR